MRAGLSAVQLVPQSTTTRPCAARASVSRAPSCSRCDARGGLCGRGDQAQPGGELREGVARGLVVVQVGGERGQGAWRGVAGECGQPGARWVCFGEQDRRAAFAGGAAGEQQREGRRSRAAGQSADRDQGAAEGVEGEPIGRRAIGSHGARERECASSGLRRPRAHLPPVAVAHEANRVDAVALTAEVRVVVGEGLLACDDDPGGARSADLELDGGDGAARPGLVAREGRVDPCALGVGEQLARQVAVGEAGERSLLTGRRVPAPVDPPRCERPRRFACRACSRPVELSRGGGSLGGAGWSMSLGRRDAVVRLACRARACGRARRGPRNPRARGRPGGPRLGGAPRRSCAGRPRGAHAVGGDAKVGRRADGLVVEADFEVQVWAVAAAGAVGDPDRLSAPDELADVDEEALLVRVAGAQRAGVLQAGEVAVATGLACGLDDRDASRCCGKDRRPARHAEVDAGVAGLPRRAARRTST